jgi:hypothetical protein
MCEWIKIAGGPGPEMLIKHLSIALILLLADGRIILCDFHEHRGKKAGVAEEPLDPRGEEEGI